MSYLRQRTYISHNHSHFAPGDAQGEVTQASPTPTRLCASVLLLLADTVISTLLQLLLLLLAVMSGFLVCVTVG
jgi:hypothetical protein